MRTKNHSGRVGRKNGCYVCIRSRSNHLKQANSQTHSKNSSHESIQTQHLRPTSAKVLYILYIYIYI